MLVLLAVVDEETRSGQDALDSVGATEENTTGSTGL